VADDPTKKRLRRAAKRLERQRRRASVSRNPVQQRRGRGSADPPPPDWFDNPEGGSGVREPRRPFPGQPAGALEREPAEFDELDVAAMPLR
jgi:hypothetical protein